MSLDFWKHELDSMQKIGAKPDMSVDGLGFIKLLNQAFRTGGKVHQYILNGNVNKKIDHYDAKMVEMGGSLMITMQYPNMASHMYFWNDGIVEFDISDSGSLSLSIAMMDEERAKTIYTLFKEDQVTPTKKGYIFAIMRHGSNLQMQSIGFAGTPLEKDNYNPKIVEDYEYIIKDLKSSQPSGRIAIFDGPPGTGKCVAEGSLIMNYNSGLLEPIEKIIDDKSDVLTFSNKDGIVGTTPSNWVYTGVKECTRIVTRSGNHISGTPEHPVMTVDGWRELKDISHNDCVGLAAEIPEPKQTKNMDDRELVILAGLLSEGNYSQNHVEFTNNDKEIVDMFDSALSFVEGKLTQYKSHKKFEHRVISPLVGRKSKIRLLLDKHNLGHSLAKNKVLPEAIFSLNKKQLAKFIGFFWSGDGSVHSRNVLTLGLASEKMIDQFQHLLLRLGIVCNKRFKLNKLDGKLFPNWELVVISTCKETFKNTIPLFGPKKKLLSEMIIHHNPNDDLIPLTEKLKLNISDIIYEYVKSGGKISNITSELGWKTKKSSVSNLIRRENISKRTLSAICKITKNKDLEWLLKLRWSKITDIANVGNKKVYDLTIPNNHSFIANDILVHNTYMVRSVLMEVPDAMFVLVPPAMVSSLGGPELLPMLLQHRQSYSKSGPTVFILEDADSCLAPRASDNMDSVTSILNIGDGIFGSLFDIRIVATTNAKQKDMDEAVVRAGRLSRRVAVGRLGYEDANRIYSRLLPGHSLPEAVEERAAGFRPSSKTKDWSLAEVYRSARDNGWEPKDGKEPSPESELVEESDYDNDYDYDEDE